MKKLHLHIVVYFMAATVLVATTGLSVHHLYCYCKGEMVTTLFHPNEPCGMMEQASSQPCCKGNTCETAAAEKKHHCSDCTSVFVKLDAKYLPSFLDLKYLDFIAPQIPHFAKNEFVVFEKNLLRWEQDLPPPPAGRALLPWIQSYLC